MNLPPLVVTLPSGYRKFSYFLRVLLLIALWFPLQSDAAKCDARLNLSNGSAINIFQGDESDFREIIRISNQHRDVMGQVLKHNLIAGIREKSLLVAKSDSGKLLGFVLYHTRRDGWNTVYDIAVAKENQGVGVGKILLDKVPRPRQLKVVKDHIPSHRFYLKMGLEMVGTSTSRKGRHLLHFQDPVD